MCDICMQGCCPPRCANADTPALSTCAGCGESVYSFDDVLRLPDGLVLHDEAYCMSGYLIRCGAEAGGTRRGLLS